MTSPSDDGLVRGYAGRLLVAISTGWFAIQAGRLVLSPMLSALTADIHITNTKAGFAFTTLWGLYALLQYPSGRLSDALSRKTLLVTGLGMASGGFVVLATARSYAALLVGAAIVGTGAGLYPTAARALVADLYSTKQGRAFGLHTASGDLGGMSAAGIAAVALALLSWRYAFVPIVGLTAAVAIALHVWSRESYVFERRSLAVRDTAARLLSGTQFRWILVAYTLYAFTWQAIAAFLPTFFTDGKEFAPVVGTVAFGALFAVGAIAKPTAGTLSDTISRRALAVGALVLGAAALSAVVVVPSPVAAVGAVVVFAAGLLAFPPVMQSYLMDAFPPESAGGDLGAMRTVYIGLGALGPTYVGAVSTAANYEIAFWGLVGALIVAAVIIARVT
ncbi:MFS transporter [Halobacterium salinarum]|uniref:MFS transporter n=1 Tax=Halobacterium salinarum TaxID=2242 RepID=UPI001F1B4BC9|nr:MFS transporter [Halobacterium salinarum]MCF2208205.1 MFS transporter [Halobacterium salinarum]MDL0124284.1 MFS transporter [Halobacterium salinarum]MDL0145743.1 MFS transporter [Halobacterium salinarum]